MTLDEYVVKHEARRSCSILIYRSLQNRAGTAKDVAKRLKMRHMTIAWNCARMKEAGLLYVSEYVRPGPGRLNGWSRVFAVGHEEDAKWPAKKTKREIDRDHKKVKKAKKRRDVPSLAQMLMSIVK